MKLSKALLLCCCFCFSAVQAQYDPTQLFLTDFYDTNGNLYRSASGQPGPQYWQNEADYQVEASFDVKTHVLDGEVVITYTNNSPDDLQMLWLQLDQNKVDADAKAVRMTSPNKAADATKGYVIQNLTLARNTTFKPVAYKIYGTRLQLRLSTPVKSGETVRIAVDYRFTQQKKGGRSGILSTKNGEVFEFSYWYPRMSVYDDYYGWNTLPFIGGGEMYLDYGTIDYKLSVPANQVVVGSGVLVNKGEILNRRTLRRLKRASHSDKTVMIRKPTELDEPVTKKTSGMVTWHFRMENTRDVAWAMSAAYVWDAAKIELPDGQTALAQSVYPKQSIAKKGWPRSTQMLKKTVEFFSDFVMPYPYKVATSVAGAVGGMEFPGLAFNHWSVGEDGMFLLVSHEIGHTWFPMIVGSDERRNPFMDEGFNTFIDIYAEEAFNNGEFAPKRDGEYAPNGGNPADEIIQVIAETQGGPTIMTAADNMPYKYVHPLDYFKTAFGLVLLREVILGPERFDYAFQHYAETWAYKHPRPEDFFRSMANASGEDLVWFWNGWFYHNWQLDQEIVEVKQAADQSEGSVDITVKNNKKMAMPILVKVEEHNGDIHEFKVPVDVWRYGKTASFTVPVSSAVKTVTLDPNHQLPDVNRGNNTWKG